MGYMDDLHKHSISILDPGSTDLDKAGVTLVTQDRNEELQVIDQVK
jgi:hypothetical protein